MKNNPVLAKFLAIGAIALLLCVVLSRINGLIEERQMRQNQAIGTIEDSLAGPQVLIGPLMQRTCTESRDVTVGEGKDRTTTATKREFVVRSGAAGLRVDSDLRSDARSRGLFRVNTYGGNTTVQARWDGFDAMKPVREFTDSKLVCGPVSVMLAVSDVRGLRSVTARLDGEAAPVRPGTRHTAYATGIHLDVPEARVAPDASPLMVAFTLDLVGTGRLSVVPAADNTIWSMRSDWPHPSFGGRFLPVERAVSDAGFTSRWTVSSLASTAPQAVLTDAAKVCDDPIDEAGDAGATARRSSCLQMMTVGLIDPVNPYVLADRATKYALLFIALTFAGVGLTEVMARRRVHPVQYLLVGLALAVFYLLLLSLSEHVGFGAAYGVATSACVLLLGFYARHMLGSARLGQVFAVAMAALYGLLWVLLRLEQTALLVGSAMLFAVLTAAMVATRKVDWYALAEQWRRPAPSLPTGTVGSPAQPAANG